MTWSKAFARQAHSDFAARDALLQHDELPECHQLHFLQMAMEKLAKAHLLQASATHEEVRKSHAYIAKVIPLIVRQELSQAPGHTSEWVVAAVRVLARRVELLSPSVTDGGASPSNCEYPWQSRPGEVVAPSEYDFRIEPLFERAGVTMLKVLKARAAAMSA